MITNKRTSQILAHAKQQRADLIMDAFSNHPIALVLVLAFAVLAATVDLNVSPDAATASHEAGQVTDVGER